MTIKSSEEIIIYESPDGGKTVYTRKQGEAVRHLHSVDSGWLKKQELNVRWVNLKELVYMTEHDPILHDMLEKVEIYYKLKNN